MPHLSFLRRHSIWCNPLQNDMVLPQKTDWEIQSVLLFHTGYDMLNKSTKTGDIVYVRESN